MAPTKKNYPHPPPPTQKKRKERREKVSLCSRIHFSFSFLSSLVFVLRLFSFFVVVVCLFVCLFVCFCLSFFLSPVMISEFFIFFKAANFGQFRNGTRPAWLASLFRCFHSCQSVTALKAVFEDYTPHPLPPPSPPSTAHPTSLPFISSASFPTHTPSGPCPDVLFVAIFFVLIGRQTSFRYEPIKHQRSIHLRFCFVFLVCYCCFFVFSGFSFFIVFFFCYFLRGVVFRSLLFSVLVFFSLSFSFRLHFAFPVSLSLSLSACVRSDAHTEIHVEPDPCRHTKNAQQHTLCAHRSTHINRS